jgi:regulator of PEP synthase PpsR (kinase-PPPase family)
VPGYAEREAVELELEESRALMRRLRCIVIQTGARAIEEEAQEIITRVAGGLLTRD